MTSAVARSWKQLSSALASSILVGFLISPFELMIMRDHLAGHVPSAVIAVVGLDVLFAILIGTPFVLLMRLAGRAPLLVRLRRGLATPGRQRISIVMWLIATAVALAFLGLVGIVTTLHCLQTFHNNANVSIVLSLSAMLVIAGAFAVALSAVVPRAVARVSESRWATTITGGWTSGVVAYVLAIAVLTIAVRVLAWWLAPSDPTPGYLGVAALAIAIPVLAVEYCYPAGRRRLLASVLGAAAAIAAAVVFVANDAGARSSLEWNNTMARAALQRIYALADRDHDGVPGALGGADCDDDNPAISPLARDVPGNGIDENCTGHDAPAPERAVPPERDAKKLDIVLITVDTLRADHVGVYGARHPTPSIDAFAATATRFARAYSPSPMTRRALPALLYGRYASTLPFDSSGDAPTLRTNDLPTIASLLAADGYETRIVMAVPGVLENSWLAGFGSTQVVSGTNVVDNARDVTDAAIRTFNAGTGCGAPTLTWIHYFDPHNPYLRPAGAPDYGDRDEDIYDSEIASLDAEIGRLIDTLRARGALSRTIVVLTADHGEGFGGHGYSFHGRSLYDDQVRIPLLIYAPQAAPRTVETPVSLVDVTPTLLDLVGLGPPAGMNGRSLRPAIAGGAAPVRPVLTELIRDHSWVSRNMLGMIDGVEKVIWNVDDNSYEVYALDRDAQERVDLSSERPARDLRERLGRLIDAELGVRADERGPLRTHGIEAIK